MGSSNNTSRLIRCFAAITLLFGAVWLLNQYVYPQYVTVYAPAREVTTGANSVFCLIFAIIAFDRPSWLKSRGFIAINGICYVLGVVLITWALSASNGLWLCIGGCMLNLARTWVSVLVGLSLLELDLKQTGICIAGAAALTYVIGWLSLLMPSYVGFWTYFAIPVACFLLIASYARPVLQKMNDSASAHIVAVTEPHSFVPFSHVFFVCIFMFRLAFGYSLTLNSTDGLPVLTLVSFIPLIVVAVNAAVPSRNKMPADILYQVSFLFIIAGFFAILSGWIANTWVPNTLLNAGATCFEVLMWFMLVALGRRNPGNAVAIIAWGNCASGVGTLAGTSLGHASNSLFLSNPDTALLAVSIVAFCFVAFNITALRSFSFEGMVRGVETLRLPHSESNATGDHGVAEDGPDRVSEQCAKLAEHFGLTERETEVLDYLARGRNVPFIQEELTVSHNTVKTHIKHIYQKMDVHSQQDIIDMVETF